MLFMSGENNILLAKRIGSMIVDASLEFGGGLMGSYFGAMVAALVTALRHHDPVVMQESIWRGFGFGFVFCSLAISFVNRVLIQGLSRASLGKKFFKIELVTSKPFTWQLMISRWILAQVSMAMGGAGYIYMLFNPEHRTAHDAMVGTDVVLSFQPTSAVSMEYHERQEVFPFPNVASRILIMTNESAERPMATVIQLPFAQRKISDRPQQLPESPVAEIISIKVNEGESSLAEVIDFNSAADEKKAA